MNRKVAKFKMLKRKKESVSGAVNSLQPLFHGKGYISNGEEEIMLRNAVPHD